VTLEYEFWQSCILSHNPSIPNNCNYYPRLSKVSNSFGYSIAFSYASGTGSNTTGAAPPASFKQRTRADFYNSAAGTTAIASATYAYPSSNVAETTDIGGRVWTTTGSSTGLAIRRPGATSDTTTYTVSGGQVSSVVNEGVTTSYSRSVSGTTATMTVTNALSQAATIVSDTTTGRPTSVTDPLSRVSSYQYDTNGRLTRATAPEGNYTACTCDARGNVTRSLQPDDFLASCGAVGVPIAFDLQGATQRSGEWLRRGSCRPAWRRRWRRPWRPGRLPPLRRRPSPRRSGRRPGSEPTIIRLRRFGPESRATCPSGSTSIRPGRLPGAP